MSDDGLDLLIDSADDYQRLEHYNGEVVLEYSHSLHAYTTVENGLRLLVPGSTTICGTLDKSAPLMCWAANKTAELVTTNFPGTPAQRAELVSLYWRMKNRDPWEDLTTAEGASTLTCNTVELAKLLHEARANFRSISQEALDIGHLAHAWLEDYIKAMIAGVEHNAPLPANEKAANCVTAALKWYAQHAFRPIYSERKIYSREHGYAGTCDWLAYVTSCGDPSCCPFEGEVLELGDFKSSNALYDEYFMQLASYRHALEEEFPELSIGSVRLLRLGKEDGEFEQRTATPEEFESDLDGFLGLLQTWNWKKQRALNARFEKDLIKAEKKAAKAAADALKPKRKRRATKRASVREIAAPGIGTEIPIETETEIPMMSLMTASIPIEEAA